MFYKIWFPLVLLTLVGCGSLDPQNHLQQWVENERTSLPRKVDKYVTCVDVQAGETEILFLYTVHGLTDAQATSRKEAFHDRARNDVMGKRQQYQQAIDYEIRVTHVFRNKAAAELFRFTIKPWEL